MHGCLTLIVAYLIVDDLWLYELSLIKCWTELRFYLKIMTRAFIALSTKDGLPAPAERAFASELLGSISPYAFSFTVYSRRY